MVESFVTLDNGLRLFVKRAPLHSVSIAAGIGYGSLNEFGHTQRQAAPHTF